MKHVFPKKMKKNLFLIIFLLFSFWVIEAKTRKAVYIIIDGVPADLIERLKPPTIFEIASYGAYSRAYTGGEVGGYSQTATISAIGYTNLLTSTWVNKHNVTGNYNLSPNYNYWTLFRIAKEQKRNFKTAIYSSWTDNRTVLIGEGKSETNFLEIDFVEDGFEKDSIKFPKKEKNLHIFDIDEHVSQLAAEGIKNNAPDLSWVYLWYTDDASHLTGNGSYFDEYVMKADKQLARIWEAVKYREKNFNEEWMIVVCTDHGRGEDGYNHGGQSQRERTIWISTNVPTNDYFNNEHLAIVDIAPSICRFMGFEVPRDVLWEQDGMPFIGKVDISNLQATRNGNFIHLTWNSMSNELPVTIYASSSNNFKNGKKDEWIKLATVKAGTKSHEIDLNDLPTSDFYKFVVQTTNNHLNRWFFK